MESAPIVPESGGVEKGKGGFARALGKEIRGGRAAWTGSGSRGMMRPVFRSRILLDSAMANEMGFIDPTAVGSAAKVELAPRPADLSGKVVGLLDNTKEQADVILETLGSALRERYDVARVVSLRKEHYSKPATDEMIEKMAGEVDVAIAALGG